MRFSSVKIIIEEANGCSSSSDDPKDVGSDNKPRRSRTNFTVEQLNQVKQVN